MRTFGLSEFLFIVQAAQWTLALSAIAFVGGALLGLVVALSRTSENAVARNAARVFIQVFRARRCCCNCSSSSLVRPCWGLTSTPGWRRAWRWC